MNPHRWFTIKRFPWTFCGKCGLVCLKNEATQKAMNKSCKGEIENE